MMVYLSKKEAINNNECSDMSGNDILEFYLEYLQCNKFLAYQIHFVYFQNDHPKIMSKLKH